MHIDSSRQPYKVVLDSGLKFNARSVVIATGAQYARLPVEEAEAFALSRSPLLLETSVPGIFAVGDTRAGSVNGSHQRLARARWRSISCIDSSPRAQSGIPRHETNGWTSTALSSIRYD